MDHYELIPNVYRIQAGVGTDGEIFGGILLKDNPTIVIGCSGGMKFVRALSNIIDDLDIDNDIRIYFPSVTFNEIYTASLVKKKFPDILLYVHISLVDEFKQPEDKFARRYFTNKDIDKYLDKNLPKYIPDVLGYDKAGSFETENTKLLFIPFSGPHKGHSFIYSRDHKLLCGGIVLGRTSDSRKYYIDKTGSLFQYENGLSFLEKARSEIIFPSYDEPEFSSDLKFKVEITRDAIKDDRKNILDICSLKPKSLDKILEDYMKLYGNKNSSEPYDIININKTKVYKHLEQLVEDKQVVKHESQYILKK